jgi:hypothetical protein
MIGFLEWSLPLASKAKVDFDWYVSNLNSKADLIKACNATEQNEQPSKRVTSSQKNPCQQEKKKGEINTLTMEKVNNKKLGEEQFKYCTVHGENPSHNISEC